MFRPYELYVGLRYTRAKRRNHFISFISLISMLGIALGVTALITVLSVMNGFEQELRSRILAVTSHAQLMGVEETLPDWRRAEEVALTVPNVVATAPYIESSAMVAKGSQGLAAQLRGIVPEREKAVGGLAGTLTAGSLDDLVEGEWRVILGEALAEELGVGVGDTVVLVVPKANFTPAGLEPRRKTFRVAGLFRSGMYEYDRLLSLMHAGDAAKLLRMGDAMTGVRLAMDDPLVAPQRVRELGGQLGGTYYVSDWTRIHPNFFRSIQMTKSMLFVILSMIVAIAAFNIVATLVMVVKDKEPDIAILRTFGAGPGNILRVFGVQGAWIGITGVVSGLALGALLSANLEGLVHLLERIAGIQFLDAKVYFMSDLPARVQWGDVTQVAIVALLLCLLATIYPAWRAARVPPAEALRHD